MCGILALVVFISSYTRWCGPAEFPDKLFAEECFELDGLFQNGAPLQQRLTSGQAGFCIYNVTSNMLTHAPGSSSVVRKWIADRNIPYKELEYLCHRNYRNQNDPREQTRILARLAHELWSIQQSLDALANTIGEEMVLSTRRTDYSFYSYEYDDYSYEYDYS